MVPGHNAPSASFPCSRDPGPRQVSHGITKPPVCFGLSVLLLTCLCPLAATWPLRSEPHGCRGSRKPWETWKSLSEGVLGSLPAPPQFNPPSSPQYKIKSQSVGRKSQNHDCLLPAPVLGKPLVPYPPARASHGNHPTHTLCPVLSAAGGQRSPQGHSRRFMRCHCRQRSVLRP